MFRTFGTREDYVKWFHAISEHIGPTVSPGGAANFCHVSRAAVHKRIKSGKLTAFMFYAPENNQELPVFLRLLRMPAMPYVYLPWEECLAWIEERRQRGAAAAGMDGPGVSEEAFCRLVETPKAIRDQLKRIEEASRGKKK